ncbi:hypothetical protein MRX96_019213 [Rhipicephalus microplus]
MGLGYSPATSTSSLGLTREIDCRAHECVPLIADKPSFTDRPKAFVYNEQPVRPGVPAAREGAFARWLRKRRGATRLPHMRRPWSARPAAATPLTSAAGGGGGRPPSPPPPVPISSGTGAPLSPGETRPSTYFRLRRTGLVMYRQQRSSLGARLRKGRSDGAHNAPE